MAMLSHILVAVVLLASWQYSKGKLTVHQQRCELEAMNMATRLADRFNSLEEKADYDLRVHHDYLVKYLGFSGWIQTGLWKNTQLTAFQKSAPEMYRSGGWGGTTSKSVSESAYWPLENKWLYLMGDSTMRQVWGTLLSPLTSNEFERNAKEWTREQCARQFPHRRQHPADHFFPEEGWGGRCGNNEVTCHLSGYGPEGKISFDWKHFSWEDYDEWIFGETGLWQRNSSADSYPHFLVVHVGLHTCVHSWTAQATNNTMISQHEAALRHMVQRIQVAIWRTPANQHRTTVVYQLPGRGGGSDPRMDHCSRQFNRVLAKEAHNGGYAVLEREEIERRLLYRSEYWPNYRSMKSVLHLTPPAPQIVATGMLYLLGCLQHENGNHTTVNPQFRPNDIL